MIMENLEQSLVGANFIFIRCVLQADILKNPQDRGQILEDFIQQTSHQNDNAKNSRLHGAKHLQSQILTEMLAIDEGRAKTTISAWQKFIAVVSSRKRSEPFMSLEEYLPYRISDAGEL
jgi:hypothetical protein